MAGAAKEPKHPKVGPTAAAMADASSNSQVRFIKQHFTLCFKLYITVHCPIRSFPTKYTDWPRASQ